ncbi:MAG: hypothetical protein NC044_01790 [Prevotella sp.]|nr:hypothetical protein [Prevotella sp.]
MSKIPHSDLDDDQIRFIFPSSDEPIKKHRFNHKILLIAFISILIIGVSAGTYVYFRVTSAKEEIAIKIESVAPIPVKTVSVDSVSGTTAKAFTSVQDTTVNSQQVIILTPIGGKPELVIGGDVLNDSSVTLVVQAADIRGDNGRIVGTFVSKGYLISTGESKAGFCAIIGGNITVGVADASPFLEQALDTEGDFFRQYPLVVGGQIVENKPKGKSYRKALAELGGKIVVIISRDRMTFHDFSQSLADIGVSNAIYLVGSKAYGFAKEEDGRLVSFGTRTDNLPENVSFIVWRE